MINLEIKLAVPEQISLTFNILTIVVPSCQQLSLYNITVVINNIFIKYYYDLLAISGR